MAFALAGCSGAQPTSSPTPPPAIAAGAGVSGSIISQGKVVPIKNAALSLPISGMVARVPAKEGDHVDAGALLIQLDAGQQQAAVAQAQAQLQHAQAARQKLDEGADRDQVIAAHADLVNAEAALRQAQAAYDAAGGDNNPDAQALATTLDLQTATNNRDAAQARLNVLMEGPKPADIAAAESDIASARAGLDRAQADLAQTELHAPFAGTVATIHAKVGEAVTAAAPIVQLADFSAWQVETTDLTELNIVDVQLGDVATLSFDAIPDLDLSGKVANIEPFGADYQGDTVYKVTVTPDQMDDRLRWNMTAKVTIEPK